MQPAIDARNVPQVARTMLVPGQRPQRAVLARSVSTKSPEVADYAIDTRVSACAQPSRPIGADSV